MTNATFCKNQNHDQAKKINVQDPFLRARSCVAIIFTRTMRDNVARYKAHRACLRAYSTLYFTTKMRRNVHVAMCDGVACTLPGASSPKSSVVSLSPSPPWSKRLEHTACRGQCLAGVLCKTSRLCCANFSDQGFS